MNTNDSQDRFSQSSTPSQEHLLPSTLRNINSSRPAVDSNQRSQNSALPYLVSRATVLSASATVAVGHAADTTVRSRFQGVRSRSTWQLPGSTPLAQHANTYTRFRQRLPLLESGLRSTYTDGFIVNQRNQAALPSQTSSPLVNLSTQNLPVLKSPPLFTRDPRPSAVLSNCRSPVAVEPIEPSENCDSGQQYLNRQTENSLEDEGTLVVLNNNSDSLLEFQSLSLTDEEDNIKDKSPNTGNANKFIASSPLVCSGFTESPKNCLVDLHDEVNFPLQTEEDIFEHLPRRSSRLVPPSKNWKDFIFCGQVRTCKQTTARPIPRIENDNPAEEQIQTAAENVGPPLPKRFQRGCFVPGCRSNSRDTPLLLFASLTKVTEHRLSVFDKIRQQNDPNFQNLSMTSGLFICELHFSSENDTQVLVNYLQGTKRKRIIPGAIPTKFFMTNQNDWTSDLLPAADLANKIQVEPSRMYVDVLKAPPLQNSNSALHDTGPSHDTEPFCLDRIEDDALVQARTDHLARLEQEALDKLAAVAAQQRMEAANLNSQVLTSVSQTSQNSIQLGPLIENLTQKSSGSDPDYIPPNTQDSMDSFARGLAADKKLELREGTINLMKKNPQLFMGVQPDFLYIIESLAEELKGEKDAEFKVMITLRKLRLNEVYELIGLYCGTSANNVSQIFRSTLPTIAACLKELTFNIPKATTLLNLPPAFRLNFYKTSHTLDCFEVQIQMPSNAKHRAICYSAYKGSPTLKYLVSVTPDGYSNYLARAYGGRNSDIGIFKHCGLLDVLESGSAVLADRGFKGLESVLDSVGVKLLRPPSVSGGRALSKEDCMTGRQIASVRIHVERFIGRLREFQMIAPHATIPVKMIPYVDAAAIVACGLTNLGAPLIRGNECGL